MHMTTQVLTDRHVEHLPGPHHRKEAVDVVENVEEDLALGGGGGLGVGGRGGGEGQSCCCCRCCCSC